MRWNGIPFEGIDRPADNGDNLQRHAHLCPVGDNWKRRAGKLVNKNISQFGFLRPKKKSRLPSGEGMRRKGIG